MPKNKLKFICSKLQSAFLILLAGISFAQIGTAKADQPNVIIIFTDDQGYQDLGSFGSPNIKTPNLDKIAKEGTRFTDFYSANSVCSPSRASLLTGRYPQRTSITGVLFPTSTNGLPQNEITIAELLKQKGYATACVGKWHIGHKKEYLPTQHGFDSYFGIPYSNDMSLFKNPTLSKDVNLRDGASIEKINQGIYYPNKGENKRRSPLMRNEEVIEFPADQSTLTKRYTDEAIRFIENNKNKPFFLYLAHTMPHIPLYATEKFRGKSEQGPYGDTVEEIDFNVGRLMKALKENQLDENTLLIYTSDNGPWNLGKKGGCAKPLRGYKFNTLEGGQRVPCLMRWPGQIPAGKVCSEISSTMDLLPTIATLADCTVPVDRTIDGKNIFDLMAGKNGAKTPHEYLYYWRGKKVEAVRYGKWKLRTHKDISELHNLESDISESRNLIEEKKEIAMHLSKKMEEHEAEVLEDFHNTYKK
ncbi:MAG: sulfatase [Planctomycetes bacterium]|nr:sulfatase [Planctomycetota bacterium]